MPADTRVAPATATAVEYFSSFSGYGPAFKPVLPVPFERTRGVAGYVEIERDARGHVAVFRKIGVTRIPGAPVVRPLAADRPPGTPVVFEAVPDPQADTYTAGAEVDYAATRGADAYFLGPVAADGRSAELRLYQRAVVFTQLHDRDARGRLIAARNVPAAG